MIMRAVSTVGTSVHWNGCWRIGKRVQPKLHSDDILGKHLVLLLNRRALSLQAHRAHLFFLSHGTQYLLVLRKAFAR